MSVKERSLARLFIMSFKLHLLGLIKNSKEEQEKIRVAREAYYAQEALLNRKYIESEEKVAAYLQEILDEKKKDILFLIKYNKFIEVGDDFFQPEGHHSKSVKNISLFISDDLCHPDCIGIINEEDSGTFDYDAIAGYFSYGFLENDISPLKESADAEKASRERERDEEEFERLRLKLGK